jgi:hypothetical protein
VTLAANHFAATVHSGHRLVAWVTAADALFYKPYVGSLGGSLEVGPRATLTVPLLRR